MKQPSRTTFSALFELGRIMRRKMSERVALSLPQVEALLIIRAERAPLMGALAERLKITAPSTTALVRELVAQGLIARKGGSDRRKVALTLTKKGARLLQETERTRTLVITEVLSGLSRSDRREFDRIIQAIIKSN